ncbi:MAG TPA: HlyD family efflux transporter periplasmic adaptor subunit [Polyangia bacterium]
MSPETTRASTLEAPFPTNPTDGAGQPLAGDPSRARAREARRRLARLLRRALLGLALAGAAAAVVLALRPRPVPVDGAPVTRGKLVVAVEESGQTRVKDRYLVSAPAAGTLSRLMVEPGDLVREGDTLAEIAPALAPLLDPRARAEAEARVGAATSALDQARAQAARAEAARTLAETELERSRALAAGGAMTKQALEQAEFATRMRVEEAASARFAVKVAAEEVRLSRAALGSGGTAPRPRHVDVIAPVSGRVLRVFQKSAGNVQAGAPLLEVGDPAALEIVVDLLTTAAVQVTPGLPVVISGWGGEGLLNGRVRLVEPSGFTRPSALGVDEQRVNVIVALTDPRSRWAALGDGFRVEARLVLWQGNDVRQAPIGAVFRHGDGWALYRIEGTRAKQVPVTLGHRSDDAVEILSGAEVGDVVAVHPGERVQTGARVEVR